MRPRQGFSVSIGRQRRVASIEFERSMQMPLRMLPIWWAAAVNPDQSSVDRMVDLEEETRRNETK